MAKTQKAAKLVSGILDGFLEEHGLELYHVEYAKQGKDWYLTVNIDIPDDSRYISTEDCELVSRYLSEKLDESGEMKSKYYLVVCSPGMDRVLYEQKDYDRFRGKLVDVRLYKNVDGKKEYQGVLVGLIDGNVVIRDEENQELKFPLDLVSRTSLAVVFQEEDR
ncbi:MAG: ribosome maturation factor RimP [Anaerovoracaceae bacterium]|jgi:ribosome maturation factor RimP